MKIESIRIENFRIFKDQTINLTDFNCLVGANGTGKSTVIYALNIFFREFSSELGKEDFHAENTDVTNTDAPVKITVTFTNLSDEAKENLKHYVRHDKLVVTAEAKYDSSQEKANVKQYGSRLVIKEFGEFFEKHDSSGVRVSELRECYVKIKMIYPELPNKSTKQDMHDALRTYEEEHKELCELVPSEDQFYGFSRGVNLLSPFIQWVFIPAVKEATDEQRESKNTALGKILQRTVRSDVNFDQQIKDLREHTREDYQKIIDKQQDVLSKISTTLTNRIIEWAHPNASLKLEWMQDPDKGVSINEPYAEIIASEGLFKGNISRFGHGLKRSYLFALLQVLAEIDNDKQPRMILACEEPELYQHPPQARNLSYVLQRLSEQNSQVIICTHSPLFIHGDKIESIRKFNIDQDGSSVVNQIEMSELCKTLRDIDCLTEEQRTIALLPKLHQELQPHINEMFFTPVLVLVEGLEDLAYLKSHLHLTGELKSFLRYGCHIVPANGKSGLIKPYAIAKQLNIPTFIIFDADGDEPDQGKRIYHKKENERLMKLHGSIPLVPFPPDIILLGDIIVWDTEIAKCVSKDYAQDQWDRCWNRALSSYDNMKNSKKNVIVIAEFMEILYGEAGKSQKLEDACEMIIEFAKKNSPIYTSTSNQASSEA